VLIAAVGLAGCIDHVQSAGEAYEQGRYLEVAEELARYEANLGELSPANRARYGMYRGLSLAELEDIGGARQWLRYSLGVERSFPGSLTQEQRMRVEQAERELGVLHRNPRLEPTAELAAPGDSGE
jgi:hypothetical protein